MIAVVNYGMGNLGSVKNAFDYIGVEAWSGGFSNAAY